MSEHQQPKKGITAEGIYTVTEKMLQKIELQNGVLLDELRSRPHPAPSVNRNKEGNLTLTYDEYSLTAHDAAIARKAREDVLGLARDMYSLMMCVEKINTDEFMGYYAERMKGLKEQYESLRSTQQQAGEP